MDAIVQQLAERRAFLEYAKHEHARFSSIVGRIPEDVLSIIFEYTIPSYLTGRGGLSQRRSSLSLNVSRVCQRWRTVALGNPKLWNKFYVNMTKVAINAVPPRFFELAARCRLHPTYLFIRSLRYSRLEQSGIPEGLSNTCKGVELFCPRVSYRSMSPILLDRWLARNLPNLVSLSLLGYHLQVIKPAQVDQPHLPAFSRLSNLNVHFVNDFDVQNFRDVDLRAVYQLRLPALRRLVLFLTPVRYRKPIDMIQLADSFPGLEELHIYSCSESNTKPSSTGRTATFSHLKVLTWVHKQCTLNQFRHAFQSLVLPSLSELTCTFTLKPAGTIDSRSVEVLEACLTRSQCLLKRMNAASAASLDSSWNRPWAERLRNAYPQLQLVNEKTYFDVNEIKAAWYH
ncbi:hypothetical protein CONPUDRAFT_70374 [Coniophora puteana RWD-64-598 SS2]|uniref:Uncharacterized protein n=1 Tax=Coniophora puteana (strain RWD-64-598) TaxID=741705 RepID=A0A5M3N3X5_CONPW|nr:uncharacterized protein CONPUDRAFT_70374 [Coniophora puteana RWD-64-598 SS2]EIW85611.1 hypothetical protein CONPUDRAFT_70374 [Coniophora puteana RWD-64-598 SS2]